MTCRVSALLGPSLFALILGLTPLPARALPPASSAEPAVQAKPPQAGHRQPRKRAKTRHHARPAAAATKPTPTPPKPAARARPLDGLRRLVFRVGSKVWLALALVLVGALAWLCAANRETMLKALIVALQTELAQAKRDLAQEKAATQRARSDATQARAQAERLRADLDARKMKSRALWAERQAIEAAQARQEDEEDIDWPARQMALLEEVIAEDPLCLHRRPVLNDKEKPIFEICAAWADRRGLRTAPQTCVGAFVGTRIPLPKGKRVHGAYNSKRVDFLICNQAWWPLIVVEHQGGGHSQGDGDQRFAVKQKVFGQTLLMLVETEDDEAPASVEAKLESAWKAARRANKLYWPPRRIARQGSRPDLP